MSVKGALICAAIAWSLGAAACGGGASTDTSTGSSTLTIYASLPLQGPASNTSDSLVKAEKLALEEAGGRVGPFTVKYAVRDNAAAASKGWNPDQTSANARIAAQDKSTIAYLGELDWPASAISIPILNEVGILQISPGSTYSGLTSASGGDKGEPDKYYPAGRRTFGRVVPPDTVQAAAQVAYQRDEGCRSLAVIADRAVDAGALTRQIATLAPREGIEIAVVAEADPNASDYRDLAREVQASGAACAFFAWTGSEKNVQALRELNDEAPALKLFLPTVPALAAVVADLHGALAGSLYVTSPPLDPQLYPPAGQRFFERYRQRFGSDPDPYAIYGYEAMKLTLLAIEKAGEQGNDRAAVIDAFYKIKDRDSVLGRYSIDKNGDTTLTDYGAYRVEDGELVFERVLRTSAG